MAFDNLCKKYNITKEELNKGIDRLDLSKVCNTKVWLAICDLLSNGDIVEAKDGH